MLLMLSCDIGPQKNCVSRTFCFMSFLYFCTTARTGSRALQSLSPEERAHSVNTLADLLITKQSQILEANAKDLEEGTKSGLAKPLLSRLSLTPAKLKSLSTGLKQIADSSLQASVAISISRNAYDFSTHSNQID